MDDRVIDTDIPTRERREQSSKWICTDPDHNQWVSVVSPGTFLVYEGTFDVATKWTPENMEDHQLAKEVESFYESLDAMKEINGPSWPMVAAEILSENFCERNQDVL